MIFCWRPDLDGLNGIVSAPRDPMSAVCDSKTAIRVEADHGHHDFFSFLDLTADTRISVVDAVLPAVVDVAAAVVLQP